MSSSLTFQLRQQQQDESKQPTVSLPSPPNSSYGDEASVAIAEGPATKEQERRDSLPTHFNALTLEHFSTSLPENYTIEHSSSPIPIQSHARKPHPRAESPSIFHHLSPTATAAATGGRTIRNTHRAKSIESSSSSSLPNFHTIRNKRDGQKQLHRCEDCGKVYKHPSCLSKHRWEHSDEWELTSKLLLTKHQQVQMLEAAAILVSLDTRRVEEEKAREQDELVKKQREIDDDDDGSINIDDDDDDDDESIVDNMEMDDDESISIASSTASSPGLLPASFPHGDD
ncbi:hypothetical protein BJV82DRAFT_595090 [Fennellomyces sp. T-0311]|nr:hypothetical protein BJV82DRAFT_595090 [Fennellomyces sp. T-0311]